MKSRRTNGGYIVYDPDNFQHCHTHTRSKDVAYVILHNVERNRIPKSRDTRLIVSHIRVATNEKYLNQLVDYLDTLRVHKKVGESEYGKSY